MNCLISKANLLVLWATTVAVAAGTKVLPVLNQPIANRQGLAGFPLSVDLNQVFGTEAIDEQVVRFTSDFSNGASPIVLDIALFSNRTPVTRTNFLNYVNDGRYANSFIHRSVPDFVIQGGGFRIINNNITEVPTDPPIINEFGISNTLGTVSMAKLGGNPNSATSQWFISLGANTDILDPQNGGFTVFGRITRDTFPNAQIFGDPLTFPIFNYGGVFSELPLFNTHVLGNLQIDEFILFPTVSLAPLPAGQAGESTTLIYSLVSNSNPTVATASIQSPFTLNLHPQAGQTGTTTITVRAADSVGNTVDDTFILQVVSADTYNTWASRTTFPDGQNGMNQNPDGDSLSNLQEYAFLGNPAVPSEEEVPVIGKSGAAPSPEYLTLKFPIRKFTTGLSYVVEANNSLSGNWSNVWTSSDGFFHEQVAEVIDQADRTVITIKDSVPIGNSPTRFLRTRIVQD